jgi:hypothetical protein
MTTKLESILSQFGNVLKQGKEVSTAAADVERTKIAELLEAEGFKAAAAFVRGRMGKLAGE